MSSQTVCKRCDLWGRVVKPTPAPALWDFLTLMKPQNETKQKSCFIHSGLKSAAETVKSSGESLVRSQLRVASQLLRSSLK